ncbi:MAG: ferric uptake regulator, Fur family [Solirubrobacterales bacterium]|jgi:Fur family ferric uptake transcriptional regulator|nr:ferric uptake regulator, Fur family [Solirubrobacterales bacterium]
MTATPEWTEHAIRTLRVSGHRAGGARQVVIDVLAETGGGLTAADLVAQLGTGDRRAAPASVYRALAALEDLGLIRRIEMSRAISRYELVLPSGEHHHHMVCISCGHTETFRDATLERALHLVEQHAEFNVQSHDVILHGLCRNCDTVANTAAVD